jgi:hypothetical protein
MATTYSILGQVNPNASTETTLYTVPASTQSVLSTLTICNSSSAQITYRLAALPDGDSLSQKHYISFDSSVLANDTVGLSLGLTLNSGDSLIVYSSDSGTSFNAFGSEITE